MHAKVCMSSHRAAGCITWQQARLLEAWLYSKLTRRQLTGCMQDAGIEQVDFYSEEHAASMHDLLKARPRSVAIQ